MTNKQKLELTWIGKEKRPRLEPRIFLEDPELSYQGESREKVHLVITFLFMEITFWHLKLWNRTMPVR